MLLAVASASADDYWWDSNSLTLGTGKLGFSDFVFSPLAGLTPGTYKLTTTGSVSGTLDPVPANLTCPLGGGVTGTLQITGNDLELVVTSSSGLTGYSLWASTNAPGTTPSRIRIKMAMT